MNSFMITQNPSPKSQQEVHDYYIQHGTLVVTQQEYCKSGQQHHHIYLQTFLSQNEVVQIVDYLNPPISEHTNLVKVANTFDGSMKYIFKEAKRCQPLLYGVSYDQCKKAINRYKNNARTNLRKQKSEDMIHTTITTAIDLQSKFNRQHKEQRAIIDLALDKSVKLLQLYRDIEDMQSLQEEYTRFNDLLHDRSKLLTSDEIFDIYKSFIDIYIPHPIYNGNPQT